MKALVLSGGSGTRLRPFSYSMPKQLIPVANRPVLLHCLESIRQAGITEVGVIVGPGAGQIRAVVDDGDRLGLRITYIEQDQPRGLAHCVQIAHHFLGDDDFVMYLGDNVLDGGIEDVAETFRASRPAAQILVAKVEDPRQYGIAEVNADSRVLRLAEKPDTPRSDLAVIGVYFFTSVIHDAVRAITPSARGEYEITDAIQWLVERGWLVYAHPFSGYWKDTGRIEDVLDCNRVLLEAMPGQLGGEVDQHTTLTGNVVVEPGAQVFSSVLVGPAVIGGGTVLRDCRVGPYASVGRDCTLRGSSIEDSIVLDGASIQQVRGIRSSLIGRGAQVRSADAQDGYKLVIGDHTGVELVV
jgi:glucose-1-phosphate thymidylyltransferase